MRYLKKTTNKIFFNKWPYKVSTYIAGAHFIRSKGIEFLQHQQLDQNGYHQINSEDLKLYVSLLKSVIDNTTRREITGNQLDIYFLDKIKYQSAIYILDKFIIGIYEPANSNELELMLSNSKFTLCSNYPKGQYRYKIVFKSMPTTVRENLIAWAEKYNNSDILINPSTMKHFKVGHNKYSTYYFYAKDSSIKMLILLAAQGYVRRIEEFVLRSNININTDQEILCQH